MDVENFFEDLSEQNWKQNIDTEASHLFDELIERLQESKSEILADTLNDIRLLKEMKLEENQELTYKLFKDWLHHCLRENMYTELEEDE